MPYASPDRCDGLKATITNPVGTQTIQGKTYNVFVDTSDQVVDVIIGTDGQDRIIAGPNDTVCARGGDDLVELRLGLYGNSNDWMEGGTGNDVLDAGDGRFSINGARRFDSCTAYSKGSGGYADDCELFEVDNLSQKPYYPMYKKAATTTTTTRPPTVTTIRTGTTTTRPPTPTTVGPPVTTPTR
jgi:Ca2+-binding RTX toxin-like protein